MYSAASRRIRNKHFMNRFSNRATTLGSDSEARRQNTSTPTKAASLCLDLSLLRSNLSFAIRAPGRTCVGPSNRRASGHEASTNVNEGAGVPLQDIKSDFR